MICISACNIDLPLSTEDSLSWKKTCTYYWEKLQPLVYPNISKSSFYLLSHFREKYDRFLNYLGYFWQETGRGHNQNLIYPASPKRFLVNFLKDFCSSNFQFCGYRSQRTFQKKCSPHFQILLLYLIPLLHFWKRIR